MKRYQLFFIGSFLLALGFLLAPAQSQAHGYIVRSTPTDRSVISRAPNQVQVWFSEGLERDFSTIEVFDQTGNPVDLGDGGVDERNSAKLVVGLPSDLPDGAYLVRLRPVFVSDGHAVSDTLVFWIGEQVGAVDAAGASDSAQLGEAIWRIGLTLALIILFGTYLTYAVILRPAWKNPYQVGFNQLPQRIRLRLSILVWGALILAHTMNLVAIIQITMTLFEASASNVIQDQLWDITLAGTNFGDVWQFRTAFLIAMLFIQIIAAQQAQNRPASTHILWYVNGGLSLLTLSTMSLISHAAGAQFWGTLALVVDYLHLSAVAAWIGGVVVLAIVTRSALLPLNPNQRGQALRAMIRRFSILAMIALSIIVATGIFSSTMQLSAPRDVTNSTYGITLAAKVLLILPLLGLGVVHHLAVSPHHATQLAKRINAPRWFKQLPQTLRLEVWIALAVLFAAAWLPATPPPIPQNARAEINIEQQTQPFNTGDLALSISPAAIGSNAFDLQFPEPDASIDAITLRFSYPEYGIYSEPIPLDIVESGIWGSAGGDITQSGEWDVLLDIVNNDSELQRVVFTWNFVEEVQDNNQRSATWIHYILLLGVIGVLSVWIVPPAYQFTRQLDWTPEIIVLGISASILTALVLFGSYTVTVNSSQRIQEQRNPIPDNPNPVLADQRSITHGQALYNQDCVVCHDINGEGDTPQAAELSRTLDDLGEALYNYDDEDLYRILSQGIVNFHDYGLEWDEPSRWDVINFLRTFQD